MAALSVALLISVACVLAINGQRISTPIELAGRIVKGRHNGQSGLWNRHLPKAPASTPEVSQAVLKPITAPASGVSSKVASPTADVSQTKAVDLSDPSKKDIAMQLVSSAENSSLDWKAQYGYIEDIGDGRGYTAGIIGFCSGTGDMLKLVEQYTKAKPSNPLASFLPALQAANNTDTHAGLDTPFVSAWKRAALDPAFRQAQDQERDRVYFNPALAMAKADGLGVLGQFAYYDAAVMHGPDAWGGGLPDIRAAAHKGTKSPAQGGSEAVYLTAFLNARKAEMAKESAHRDVSRIDDAQLAFLKAGNLDLNTPLNWKMYGDSFSIANP